MTYQNRNSGFADAFEEIAIARLVAKRELDRRERQKEGDQ